MTGTLSLSSTDPSPYNSPVPSPCTSRETSPNPTRKTSPLLRLRRANSYKHKSKKVTTNLDDTIRRKKLSRRERSKSTPVILDANVNKQTSEESDFLINQEETKEGALENKNTEHTKSSKSPTHFRKKSLSALLGLSSLDLPKLRRSYSQRFHSKPNTVRVEKCRSFCIDDGDDDPHDGPLFQATTMFVPGYDFKTKQSLTPKLERKHNRMNLSRRGSAGSTTCEIEEKEKGNSTPNLSRRRSRELLNQIDLKNENKKLKHHTPSQTICHSSSDEDELETVNQLNTNYLSIPQRQAKIAQKMKTFENHNVVATTSSECLEVVLPGKVRKLSNVFEDGTAYWRNKTVTEDVKKKHCSHNFDLDDIFRERTNSYKRIYDPKHKSLSFDDEYRRCSNGGESGYASPSESSIEPNYWTEDEIRHVPKMQLLLPNISDQFSDSGSHGQWKSSKKTFYNVLTPDIERVIATDLCVTEL